MKYCNYLLLILAGLGYCSNVVATTYYVDAKNGKDSWSGTISTISATNGPWQSIARVNTAALQPGDQVLFSCGQTWYEPLKPKASGTAAAKIYFGSYPAQCTNKPKISGFRPIPSHNWQNYQGNIWKTTFPQNLIINSSLSTSAANWDRWPSDSNLTFNATCPLSVASCMNFLAGASTSVSYAISNPFPVIGGKKYAVTLSFYASAGTSAYLVMRENGNSFRPLGLSQEIPGNDTWQDVTFEFIATQTLQNARLDIAVPKSKQIYVRNARLQVSGVQPNPNMVLFDRDPVTIAHHPNAGHDISKPESVYLRTSAASPTVTDEKGSKVSSQIVVSDLKLPSGGSINPGTKLRLRNADWFVNDFSVAAMGTNTLSIVPNTPYPLSQAGWGFYFYDELWMLDSPGEWFFDKATQTLYLWTPSNENPGNRISVAAMDTAINLNYKSNLTLENFEIDGAFIGVGTAYATNVTLQYLNIHNIDGFAINVEYSNVSSVANNYINRAGIGGITAFNSTNSVIENNKITEVGIFVKANKRISLPMRTPYGIVAGISTIVSNNVLSDIAGLGITDFTNNGIDIDSNIIQRSCILSSDCGAIYIGPGPISPTRSIKNNLILDVLGGIDGTPDGTDIIANGIYLDDGTSGFTVSGNVVKGTTNAIQIHNGAQNTITDNILYGSKKQLLLLQEDTKSGAINTNTIINNKLFPVGENSFAIFNNTSFDNVDKFATFENNHYSTIHSPRVVSERVSKGVIDYTFPEWQKLKTTTNLPRNNDFNGGNPAPLASFSSGIVGNDFMANGDFSAGLQGWDRWNSDAPYADYTLEGCLPVSVNCMHFTAGASYSLFTSPKFAITKGKHYRVTFDLKSTVENETVHPKVWIGEPTNKSLMKDFIRLATSTEWKRHSFVFEATETASNPDFNGGEPKFYIGTHVAGLNLWIANLEIAPIDIGVIGPSRSDLLVNTTDIDKAMDCPTRLSNPGLCSNYVNFPEATITVWPISVPPRSGRIVFTQNLTLLDSDGDSIADSQDECSNTVKGLAVNGRGCSLID